MPLYSTKETIDAVLALLRGETDSKLANVTTTAGKSAYQLAVDNGFVGTQQQWLDSLKGAPGQPGASGAQLAGIYLATDDIPNYPVGTYIGLEVPSADAKLVGFALIAPANSTALVAGLPAGAKAGQLLVLGAAFNHGGTADYAFIPTGAQPIATAVIGTTTRQEWTYLTLTSAHIADTRSGAFPNGCVALSPAFTGAQRTAAVAAVYSNAGTPKGTVTPITTTGATAPFLAQPPTVTPDRRSLAFTAISKRATGATFAGITAPTGQALVGTATIGTSAGGETALAVAQYVQPQVGGTPLAPAPWSLPASAANFFAATIVIPSAV